MNDRLTKGLETIKQYVTEEEAARMIESDALADVAPDLRKMIIEFAYGDVYSRPGLDVKSRALVVISAVVTQGAAPQTKTHIQRGLHAGLTHRIGRGTFTISTLHRFSKGAKCFNDRTTSFCRKKSCIKAKAKTHNKSGNTY